MYRGKEQNIFKSYIALASISDGFTCKDAQEDPTNPENWSREIIPKVKKKQWGIMDEYSTEVLELVHKTKDSGTVYEWEIHYISPYSDSIERSMVDLKANQEKESNKSEWILESLIHMKLIKHAHDSQMK